MFSFSFKQSFKKKSILLIDIFHCQLIKPGIAQDYTIFHIILHSRNRFKCYLISIGVKSSLRSRTFKLKFMAT